MQAIMETLFDIVYLVTVITLGVMMLRKAKSFQYKLFGVMAVILGCGDAFHLVPRAYGLCTIGLEANAAALGFGKLVTSVTMTVFYVILFYIWKERYHMGPQKQLTITVWGLAVLRVLLCMMPQNQWLLSNAPVSWGIYRNIPFAILGVLIIVLYYRQAKANNDAPFRFLWLAVTLSFAFYIPVVLFADAYPLVGVLMIPKTVAYVWIVSMGYRAMKLSKGA